MLCADCKKNPAVIYINKVEADKTKNDNGNAKMIGLCLSCAKKRGIDPFNAVASAMSSLDPKDMEGIAKGFSKMFSGLNADDMNDSGLDFNLFGQDSDEDDDNDFSSDASAAKSGVKLKEKKTSKKLKYLDSFAINLTEQARLGKLDSVVGRTKELERLIQILNRRSKNNPALIGEPGVGKTAVINALAIKIAEGDVPSKLMNKEIYLLDMTALVAGTQFRGQFEARMKGVIDECKSYSNIILAIDEMHNIVGGMEHDGSMNAANMLKPALSNGLVQVIGATTLKEYRKYIEKDSALERRFQPIMVDEPSADDTIQILKGIKHYYEDHHKVIIPEEILKDVVRLAEKYIYDRFFPDKAIDLLDEACSRVYLDNKILNQVENIEEKLKEVENEIKEAENEIAENKVSGEDISEFEKTATLKATECSLKTKLAELNKKVSKSTLTFDNLAKVVELWTKIPVSRLTREDSEKLLELEENLNKRIIGQKNAVHALSNAILRKRSNIKSSVRPPSFIFVGPTGVGKTALVKSLAYEIFDREDAIIRLDMSEYMESHSVSKLIGSPPGYVGFDDAGYLTEKVRRNPYSIILFDEIEKAHSSIYNILLQILEDGILTDSQGRTVSFRNTIVVLTSNLGTNFKNESFGFATEKEDRDMLEHKVEGALKEYFSPEFLNRIDDIIIFNKLSKEDSIKISKLLLNEYILEIEKRHINLTYTEDLAKFIAEKGFSDKYGARPLRRAITKYIEDTIAYKYVNSEIKEDEKYIIDVKDNNIVISLI